MTKPEYKEKTVYLRKHKDTWECMAKVDGKGLLLENLPSKQAAIDCMTAFIWALATHGPLKYGTVLSSMEVMKAPDGVEYPVIEEAERT